MLSNSTTLAPKSIKVSLLLTLLFGPLGLFYASIKEAIIAIGLFFGLFIFFIISGSIFKLMPVTNLEQLMYLIVISSWIVSHGWGIASIERQNELLKTGSYTDPYINKMLGYSCLLVFIFCSAYAVYDILIS